MSLLEMAGDNWIYLFSLPQAFSPICTAELANFSRHQAEFERLGVKLVAFSQSTIERQQEWHNMMESQFGISVRISFVEDPDLSLAKCFGILHPRESTESMIRKSFVLDSEHTIRSLID